MTKKQKKTLRRILLAVVLSLCVFLAATFLELPWFLQLALWLVPYLVIGHDVLKKAVLGIKNGEVFEDIAADYPALTTDDLEAIRAALNLEV